MKNKNIISLTVAIVAVVLIGMLGLSRIFETTWQQENTVDNNLNAEITDNSDIVFNYPYVSAQEAVDDGYAPAREPLAAAKQYGSTYNENMIDIQQAVNIAGENVKYLTGYTGHQTIPVMAQYVNQAYTDDGVYRIIHYKNYVSDNPEVIKTDYVKGFEMLINPVTGEIIQMEIYYDFGAEITGGLKAELPSTAKEMEIVSYIGDVMALINNTDNGEISDIFIGVAKNNEFDYLRYDVKFKYNGIPYCIMLDEPFDNSIYYVWRYFSNFE